MEYDHVEKEGSYIDVKRGVASILAVDRRVFPKDVPLFFDRVESGRKVSEISIGEKLYIQKTFVEKGFLRTLFFSSKGLNFWNSGWKMQGKIETIKPALVYSKIDRFSRISIVLYPLEGRRIKEAIFDQTQQSLDHCSLSEIEKGLKKYRMYHSDLMIWNFIQIDRKGLKVIDLEDSILFPKYSLLFRKIHERDQKKLMMTKSAYQRLAELQMPQ